MTCSIASCQRPIWSRKMCKMHYERNRRHGDPLKCKKQLSTKGAPLAWIREHVGYSGKKCLTWPFAKFPDGRAHMSGGKPARVMCALAHGEAPSRKHQAAHRCGKGHEACVNPQHLYWATPKENAADQVLHGTKAVGSNLPQSKLTEADVREIRRLKGKVKQNEIAARFDVNPSCICKILYGATWSHV